MISAIKFQRCFSKWMKDCHEVTKGDVVAIGGKTILGTYNKDKRCGSIHMVTAFSAANQTVLGQVKMADKIMRVSTEIRLLSKAGR
ncbi:MULTISPECIES: hypothetical protein [Vibrio]|uniref:Uncharacterized protein n=1 Tax=Vibrio gigantis TaxID=296199 RepID=A0A5M9P4B7_9VIBR|nr:MULTISPECIES: hypothetical protein [Vibrio]KAA8680968.1 hypothetical protein F4W18_00025 [Vibrio gigantis]RZP77223.1 hypothetical protein D8T52_11965 [Vibrio vulnificus]HAS6310356.1 hypothetical protein [Vibrio vulnificus]HAS6363782.1 hypothetical protein [Vibrio vulnificus]HDY7543341.1 hypothetical protein [Vibrio vulnificus]